MGLLDEAIRDHLELKRRRGADPTEVAREEHEALEPVFPDEPRLGAEASPLAGEFDDVVYVEPAAEQPPVQESEDPDPPAPEPAASPPGLASHDFSPGPETAELDMQAFLDADAQTAEADPQVPEQIPGQERLTFE